MTTPNAKTPKTATQVFQLLDNFSAFVTGPQNEDYLPAWLEELKKLDWKLFYFLKNFTGLMIKQVDTLVDLHESGNTDVLNSTVFKLREILEVMEEKCESHLSSVDAVESFIYAFKQKGAA